MKPRMFDRICDILSPVMTPRMVDEWLRTTHPLLRGRRPLDVLDEQPGQVLAVASTDAKRRKRTPV